MCLVCKTSNYQIFAILNHVLVHNSADTIHANLHLRMFQVDYVAREFLILFKIQICYYYKILNPKPGTNHHNTSINLDPFRDHTDWFCEQNSLFPLLPCKLDNFLVSFQHRVDVLFCSLFAKYGIHCILVVVALSIGKTLSSPERDDKYWRY